jgi:hypothetical protein
MKNICESFHDLCDTRHKCDVDECAMNLFFICSSICFALISACCILKMLRKCCDKNHYYYGRKNLYSNAHCVDSCYDCNDSKHIKNNENNNNTCCGCNCEDGSEQ